MKLEPYHINLSFIAFIFISKLSLMFMFFVTIYMYDTGRLEIDARPLYDLAMGVIWYWVIIIYVTIDMIQHYIRAYYEYKKATQESKNG